MFIGCSVGVAVAVGRGVVVAVVMWMAGGVSEADGTSAERPSPPDWMAFCNVSLPGDNQAQAREVTTTK